MSHSLLLLIQRTWSTMCTNTHHALHRERNRCLTQFNTCWCYWVTFGSVAQHWRQPVDVVICCHMLSCVIILSSESLSACECMCSYIVATSWLLAVCHRQGALHRAGPDTSAAATGPASQRNAGYAPGTHETSSRCVFHQSIQKPTNNPDSAWFIVLKL